MDYFEVVGLINPFPINSLASSSVLATCAHTKHGDYIIQDFKEAIIIEAEGITFTQNTKMERAQLKRRMKETIFRIPYDARAFNQI